MSMSRSSGRYGKSGGCPRGVSRAGHIAEVFASIQGEGIFAGVLQIFVRTAGCSRRCVYCDTPEARLRVPRCALRSADGVRYEKNPVDGDALVSFVRSLAEDHPGLHSVSVTGGEPLEQPDFLVDFLPRLRAMELPVYLETNGLEEDACRAIAGHVDIVSLDIKLPSHCGGKDHFSTYGRVLPLFISGNLFIKVVVLRETDDDELTAAARIVAAVDRSIPFVIQPAYTADHGARLRLTELLRFHSCAASVLDDVRVIPQCHRVLGVL